MLNPNLPSADVRAFLAAIVLSSNDAIIGKDVKGNVTAWNEAAERIFGYKADEILGRSTEMLTSDGRRHEMPAMQARALSGERTDHFESVRRHKDGSAVHVSLTVSPVFDDEGRVVGTSNVARDITANLNAVEALGLAHDQLRVHAIELASVEAMQSEIEARREAESELRAAVHDRNQFAALLSTVIEVAPGLIYAKDRSGRILLANRAALDLIGKPWADVEGKRDIDFVADTRQAEIVMANDRRVIDSGKSQDLEEIIDHPVKGPRVYLSTKTPFDLVDEGVGGLVGFSIDITERSKIANDSLHMARRTAMADMAAAIAHEINQPLAAISMYLAGSAALLEKEPHEGPVIRSLALANDQCLRAGEIIRRVRSFVSSGNAVRHPENVALLVDQACRLALLDSRDNDVIVSIEHEYADIPVLVDKLQIERVIVNLIRNAMDAMGGAKGMALRVTTGYGADGMAIVSVSDSGPGISPDVFGRLFEPFVSTKGVKGMGVGLSLCRTIVEGHGGKIWAVPDAETGATLRFTLPTVRREIEA